MNKAVHVVLDPAMLLLEQTAVTSLAGLDIHDDLFLLSASSERI